MNSSMDTHLGHIQIDNEVIAQYAGTVATECFGIVGMAGVNVKDGLVKLLKMDSITRGIVVKMENNKLVLVSRIFSPVRKTEPPGVRQVALLVY